MSQRPDTFPAAFQGSLVHRGGYGGDHAGPSGPDEGALRAEPGAQQGGSHRGEGGGGDAAYFQVGCVWGDV